MGNTLILYGSTTGNTEKVAGLISSNIDNSEIARVEEFDFSSIGSYDNIIIGSSTWGIGDLQDDWEGALSDLKNADLSGKKISFFGLGDAESYPDSFVDAIGIIYKDIEGSGASFVGKTPASEIEFDASVAVVDDHFIGLVIDEDNQSNETESRVKEWCGQLKQELN
ncbi:MAG: flavodoxin [Bacteroidales bacterium]|jgi:flavodoxin I|nr:flavodoxin [Bacteroidales bacterium]